MTDMLYELEGVIANRRDHPKEGSYTTELFTAGMPRIAQKVGEEATEVIVAALAQSRVDQVNEISDLFYHTLVLMAACGITLQDINAELARRHG